MIDFTVAFGVAVFVAVLCGVVQYRSSQSKEALVVSETKPFTSFRNNYLFVYLIMTSADWIQGAYVYALYEEYGFERGDIGLLFVCGFGSSLIFGTFFGSVADKYGRKLSCILYGVLYGLSCITKHFNNFHILMFGRVLGGIATSILYSAFESWLVYQHNKNGFPGELLSRIFSLAVLGNGLIAIISGVAAYYIKEAFGMVAPFDASLTLLIIGSVAIFLTWPENYGDSNIDVVTSFKNGWTALMNDRKIVLLGLIQSLFEGAMFTFVFMWTPAMQPEDGEPIELPHGLIFATFMVCVMLGSFLFNLLNSRGSPEDFMRVVFAVSTATFAVPILSTNVAARYLGFLVFEATVGIFWPALGTMRSKYVPEETRATIMNIFRMPLNAIVVLILVNVGSMQTSTVFSCCFVFMFITCVCQQLLYSAVSTRIKETSNAGEEAH